MDIKKLTSDKFLEIYTRYALMGEKLLIDGMFYKVLNDSVILVNLDNIDKIKSLILDDFITDIDTILFYHSKIKKFVGGKSLRNILDYGFLDSKLETISFNHEVILGVSCFEDCSHLHDVVNSNFIKYVGDNAFRNTSSLKYIDLSNVDYVGYHAFINSNVEELIINSNVSIYNGNSYESSFYGMINLKKVYIKGNKNLLLENAFLDYDSKIQIEYIS